jgi:membrane protease YdiL (CAAX protease family)
MSKTIRNIVIAAFFTVGGGWLGIWLNKVTNNTLPLMQSLGALVWLVTPALSGIFLRLLGGDGWKDSGFGLQLRSGGWKWYVLALVVYPCLALLSGGLALAIGAIKADGFAAQGFKAYLAAGGVMLAGSLVKNIFEEFAWRGYLTPRLDAAGVHPLVNHLIVGMLWWSWHVPYYFYYVDRTTLKSFMSTGLPVFLLLAFISLVPTAIFFGELRLVSKSVWPTFLLHNVINALSIPLIINGFIKVNGPLGTIFTPTNEGIFVSLLFGVVGLILYRNRKRKLVKNGSVNFYNEPVNIPEL